MAQMGILGQGPGKGGLARDGGLEEGDGRARRGVTGWGGRRGVRARTQARGPGRGRTDAGGRTHRPSAPTARPRAARGQQGRGGWGRRKDEGDGGRRREGHRGERGGGAQARGPRRRHDATPRHATRGTRSGAQGTGARRVRLGEGSAGVGGSMQGQRVGAGGREGTGQGKAAQGQAHVHCQVSGCGQQGGPARGRAVFPIGGLQGAQARQGHSGAPGD
ncbi:uncharacterized protein [Marmota flaviventris]|uniref:uncharacterized protein n=1 Tax=Marmota flaviventris TaxID=93162 RepID=UPI003A838BE9